MTDNPRKSSRNATARKSVQRGRPRKQPSPPPPPEAPPVSEPPSDDSASSFAGQIDLLNLMTGTTSRIVGRAASILEEEIALGIGATQNIERRVVDVDKMRSADSQEVMQRFRKDAHDVVDILLDLVNVATNGLNTLSDRAINIGVGEPRKSPTNTPTSAGVPSLAVPSVAKSGDTIEIPMTLENESDQPIDALDFVSSDLVNTDGTRIAATHITFIPDRPTIEPKSTTTITVVVRVPNDATPGVYSGLLQATRMGQLRAVMSIQIA